MLSQVEYIWLDGAVPVQQLRSKTKIVPFEETPTNVDQFPDWSYDGSSTNQAEGQDSDVLLQPVCFVKDPLRGEGHYLLLCETMDASGQPHPTNTRAQLRAVLDAGGAKHDPWIGYEQEYTLFKNNRPLGWPEGGYPPPQGPFYCGVGPKQVYGRELVEAHTELCLSAGIMFYGLNAEVMPAQWEYQIGYRGIDSESPDPLTVADHAWIARWLLMRVGEEFDIQPSFDNKPVKGDWNGAGQHTNFSTREMRQPGSGMDAINQAVERLSKKHSEHIQVYGHKLEERLTGLHETCSISEFKAGVANRSASIRIPRAVHITGGGYFEDRRPGANADPYTIATRLIKTICDLG